MTRKEIEDEHKVQDAQEKAVKKYKHLGSEVKASAVKFFNYLHKNGLLDMQAFGDNQSNRETTAIIAQFLSDNYFKGSARDESEWSHEDAFEFVKANSGYAMRPLTRKSDSVWAVTSVEGERVLRNGKLSGGVNG